jgi:hypothetical protein
MRDQVVQDLALLRPPSVLFVLVVQRAVYAPNLGTQRTDGDLLSLHFQKIDQEQANRLKELLAEHLRSFREFFGKQGA